MDTQSRKSHRELNAEERAAIAAYAAENGARWKRRLLNDWMRSARPGILQQLRNQLGPSWLRTFAL